METIKSLLRTSSACQTKRKYDVATVLSDYAKHTAILNCRITDLIFQRLANEIDDATMESKVMHIYDDNADLNGYAKELRAKDLYACMKRYTSCENRLPQDTPNAILDVHGLEVNVDPNFMFVSNGTSGTTHSIEVIKVFYKKPDISSTAASKNIALYSMLYYAKQVGENMFPGENVTCIASFYFLRKKNDTNNALHPEKNNFDPDFFDHSGENVVSIRDFNNGNLTEAQRMTSFDNAMHAIVQDFIAGRKMFYNSGDCRYCSMRGCCSFKAAKAPIPAVSQGSLVTKFTDEQQKVLDCGRGIFSVIAGAGAGKTSVIAAKVVKALKEGMKPKEIVVITFTNAAANEMRERIVKMADKEGIKEEGLEEMVIKTFNAFGEIYLQQKYQYFGYTDVPELLETSEAKEPIEKLLLDHFVDGVNYSFLRDEEGSFVRSGTTIVNEIFTVFKTYKITKENLKDNMDLIHSKLSSMADCYNDQMLYDLIDLFNDYQAQLKRQNLYDYADQENAFRVIDELEPEFFVHTGFKLIIIDEDQDCNEAQLQIMKILRKSNVFETMLVVGDIDQSIYGFRGATPEKFLLKNLENFFGEKVTPLYITKNFRSTPEVIHAVNAFISQNKLREKKMLVSMKASGKPVIVKAFKSGKEEVEYIVAEVLKRIQQGVNVNDICVIARTSKELTKVAEKLAENGIEYNVLVPELYKANSRVMALIALYSFLVKDDDEADIATYINACTNNGWFSLTDVQRKKTLDDYKAYASAFKDFSSEDKLSAYFEMITKIPGADNDEVYVKYISKITAMRTWEQLSRLIYTFDIYGNDDKYTKVMKYDGLTLITAHSSKGLEWPVVFVTTSGFDKPALHDTTGSKEAEMMLEEERRVLHVAMSRARDELIVTGKYYCFGNASTFRGSRTTPGGENKNLFLSELYAIHGKTDLVTEYKTS